MLPSFLNFSSHIVPTLPAIIPDTPFLSFAPVIFFLALPFLSTLPLIPPHVFSSFSHSFFKTFPPSPLLSPSVLLFHFHFAPFPLILYMFISLLILPSHSPFLHSCPLLPLCAFLSLPVFPLRIPVVQQMFPSASGSRAARLKVRWRWEDCWTRLLKRSDVNGNLMRTRRLWFKSECFIKERKICKRQMIKKQWVKRR